MSEAMQAPPAPQVTVQQLDELVKRFMKFMEQKKSLEEQMSEVNKNLGALEVRIAKYLTDMGRKEYDTPVGKFTIKPYWTVKAPQTDADKMEFFKWLEEKGIFKKYATVNARSLNALYKAGLEQAQKRGELFRIPGIDAPKNFEKTKFTPKKGVNDVEHDDTGLEEPGDE